MLIVCAVMAVMVIRPNLSIYEEMLNVLDKMKHEFTKVGHRAVDQSFWHTGRCMDSRIDIHVC